LVGASRPEELVERAAAKLYSALRPRPDRRMLSLGCRSGPLGRPVVRLHFICGSGLLMAPRQATADLAKRFSSRYFMYWHQLEKLHSSQLRTNVKQMKKKLLSTIRSIGFAILLPTTAIIGGCVMPAAKNAQSTPLGLL